MQFTVEKSIKRVKFSATIAVTLSLVTASAAEKVEEDYGEKPHRYKLERVGTSTDPMYVYFKTGEFGHFFSIVSSEGQQPKRTTAKVIDSRSTCENSPAKTVTIKGQPAAIGFLLGGTKISRKPLVQGKGGCDSPDVTSKLTSKEMPKSECIVEFNKKKYRLTYKPNKILPVDREGGRAYAGSLIIKNGKFEKRIDFNNSFKVIWAGDVNEDGKLDLITTEAGEGGATEYRIYVSDETKKSDDDELEMESEADFTSVGMC